MPRYVSIHPGPASRAECPAQVLTPQYNSNLSATNDVFNHSNNHFWQYMQPGYDALDFISCTGTNFLVRANAYQVCFCHPKHFAVPPCVCSKYEACALQSGQHAHWWPASRCI